MSVLSNLKPAGVWSFFEELCKIPHGSHNEKAISDYCVAFAKERGLSVWQDDAWNVIIVKEASAGYENAEPVILQGHLDMVCVKKPDCDLDMEKEGLRLGVDGDYVYAEGTSLGGDDGIAVAYAFAILDDDSIPHPRLEVIFTTCEEVGMDGALALKPSMLKGHTMLNLDSEEEGIFLVSCAGGVSMDITLPIHRARSEGTGAVLTVEGLLGGHSGAEIHKGRANANLILARVLACLAEKTDYQVESLSGGLKDNAIPRESSAKLLFPIGSAEQAKAFCETYNQLLKKEYSAIDSGVNVRLELTGDKKTEVMTPDSLKKTLMLLLSLPNGVQAMSGEIEGLVETSLNMGILETREQEVYFCYSLRSSVSSAKEWLTDKLRLVAESYGAAVSLRGAYPAWEYQKESPLRENMVRIYEKMFGKQPKVEAIHAGLECGVLASKIPGLDCVSMGPDILDIHTTEERMSISSVERMWAFILEVLKKGEA